MTELKKALYSFWSQFGVRAYLHDCVPDDAELPYIVYSFSKPPAFDTAIMTAFNYHYREPDGNKARAAIADRIAAVIGEHGNKIPLEGGGFAVLYRNVDFQTPYKDPEDDNIIAIRTSVEMKMYTM